MQLARSKSFVHDPRSIHQQAAFSLIEIVLALGVFVFAITAILGLMSIGSNSDLAAATDTSLASMAQYVDSYVRHQGFSAVSGTNVITGVTTAAPYPPGNSHPNFYFDVSGNVIVNSNGIPDTTGTIPNSVYSCTVSITPVASGVTVPATGLKTNNLLFLRYDFRWPVTAHHINPDRTVYSSLANYE